MTLAALAGTAGAVLLGWYFFFGTTGPRPSPAAATPETFHPPERGTTTAQMSAKGGVQIDLMDKADLRRQAGRLVMDAMDPLEGHHYAAEKPQGFLFLRDGRTIHVRADKGNLYMPDRQKEPESGTLTGHVVIRAFDPRPDGKPIDPAKDTPAATIRTDSLAFDNALGKVDTPPTEQVRVESLDVTMTGRGLRIIFNQVKQRLELLEIAHGEELRYTGVGRNASKPKPAAPPPQAHAAAAPSGGTPAPSGPPAPVSLKAPVETLYKIVFSESVNATQEQRVITSDKLTVWSRLIDNKLPDGAIAPVRSAKTEKATVVSAPPPAPAASGATTASRGTTGASTPPVIAATSPDLGPENGPLVLRWSGPCVITPLDEPPPELKQDHVAMRFTGEESGKVTFEDASRAAKGHGAYLEYDATTRRMVLAGPGPASASMSIGAAGEAGSRTISAVRLEPTITDAATNIHVPGASELTAYTDKAGPNASPFRISCVDQADYTLTNENGQLTDRLTRAVFKGQVSATDPSGMKIDGDLVRAEFAPGPQQSSVLKQIFVDGHARADTGDGSRLNAEHVEASFKVGDDGKTPEPTGLTATGGFVLDRAGMHLEGGSLDATLSRNPKGDSDLRTATAKDAVKFSDKADGVSADCDLLKADLTPDESDPATRRKIVDLSGERVVLKRLDQTTITGTQMRLDGATRRLDVQSAGTLSHHETGPVPAKGGVESLTAKWSKSMAFDDAAGSVNCVGDVVADASPDPFTKDHLTAERVVLYLTPRKPGEVSAAELDPTSSRASKERKLLRAEATGSVLEQAGGTALAQLESRRFMPDETAPDGQKLVELYYIEGPRVLADNDKGTLDVPDRGRMLVLDHRAPGAAAAPGAKSPEMVPRDGRGSALFDWDGSMHAVRATGEVFLKKNVHLTHQRLETRDVTDLTAGEVTAVFRQQPASPGEAKDPRGDSGPLRSAIAVGAVHLSLGPARTPESPRPASRELAADRIVYDADANSADATAQPGGLVRMVDPAKPAPVTAKRIFWDMARDRIEIKEPGAVTIPK